MAVSVQGVMPRVAVLHHLVEASSGHAGPALAAAGIELDERRLRDGDALPALDEVDGLLSLGGEQSVLDGRLEDEAALLREAVDREVPVLGICLGSQVLAHALGGRVRRLRRPWLAWPRLDALPAAEGDPLFGALPAGAAALHWNEDGFEPPPGAVELVRRPGEGATAFRAGRCAWGVQFHPEVDEAILDGWYRDWPESCAKAGVSPAIARAADARHLRDQRALSEAIFGGFGRVVAARVPA
jgi:GMP synthase (glutamine-hydrolysing)